MRKNNSKIKMKIKKMKIKIKIMKMKMIKIRGNLYFRPPRPDSQGRRITIS